MRFLQDEEAKKARIKAQETEYFQQIRESISQAQANEKERELRLKLKKQLEIQTLNRESIELEEIKKKQEKI
jgi:hypothetical protein